MRYFAVTLSGDFEVFDSEEAARHAAEGALETYREEAPEGWSEEVEWVCWGEVREWATKRPVEPPIGVDTSSFDEWVDYTLEAAP